MGYVGDQNNNYYGGMKNFYEFLHTFDIRADTYLKLF